MQRIKLPFLALLGLILVASCDLSVPGEPDFTTSHAVEIPIIDNRTFVFLGDSTGALIDTTNEDIDSLFTIAGDGFISISTEEEFDFGDLNDAIPEIDGSSTNFNAEVGELEIGSFASGNGTNLGEANFQALTGLDPGLISVGDPVPPQAIQPEVTIDLDTDFFTSATFKSGSLDIVITNNLGFVLDDINVTLVSDPNPGAGGDEVDVVTASSGTVNDNSSTNISLPFNNGDELANPQVRVSIEWSAGQNFQRSPESIIVNSASGNNLIASSVTANLEPQDFNTSNTSSFSDTEFQFTAPSHYVELSAGQISVTNLINNMGIGIETLRISFPNIRDDDFGVEDSLVINFPAIARNSAAADVNVDLSGYRIFALNNEVTYNIVSATENTQTGPNAGPVTITENDDITASVDISGLTVGSAFGIVLSQNVLLGDNDPSNDTGSEILDVFNDTEADTTSIDGIDEFSDQIDGVNFTNPIINIDYTTNIGIETTIYAAMVGVDSEGNEVYLSGKPGSPNEVTAGDPITGLVANGVQLLPGQLIKFGITNAPVGLTIADQISFNRNTTNVDDFLNNLPSEIRFIGRAIVNESENEGSISTPLEFDPTLSVDLPLALQTEAGNPISFTDTTEFEVDLEDEQDFTEARFFMTYTNDLPLGIGVELAFVDSLGTTLFTNEDISLIAAPVDDVTRYSTGGTEDVLIFELENSGGVNELDLLKEVADIIFTASIETSGNEEVRLRATDSFTLSLAAKIRLQTKVGGE